jgi:AAA family ATP:ADP antiporter
MESHISTLDTHEIAEQYDRKKFMLLGITFFFVIAAYTVVQALKDSIFAHIVGAQFVNEARYGSMLVLTTAVLIYSRLVDSLRRYYLLCLYALLYAVGCLLFAYYLADPVIGISNEQASYSRWFGWLFYFFSEGFSPFVVSVFWAFMNSISSPQNAKKRYGNITACSKVGGILSAAFCIFILNCKNGLGQLMFTDIAAHQLLLMFAATCLGAIPCVIIYLMYAVPGRFLHGYEAVYKAEKTRKEQGKAKTGVLEGIRMLIKYPYVMGIFGMVFFYEITMVVISYLRLVVAKECSNSISEVSSFLFYNVLITHAVGFLISYFGTRSLLQKLGERLCLLLIPFTIGIVLTLFMFQSANPTLVVFAYVMLKSVNYAFSWPVREGLYIPTVKAIKFKSKSWIDAFGSKFAKSSGATFNLFARWLGPSLFVPAHALFFVTVIGFWTATAWLLGKRFEQLVKHNEVVGYEEESDEQEHKETTAAQ